jgi:hypothetical protein
MTTISRIRLEWGSSGVVGGGVSTFYSANSDPSVLITALRTNLNALAGIFPNDVQILFPSGGDTLNAETGAVTGVWSMTAASPVNGTATGSWASGVGGRLVWNTAGVTRRRRVKGSTYLVPMAANQYSDFGTIAATTVESMQTVATTLAAADGASMRVWSRPQSTTSGDGHAWPVLSGTAKATVTWLRTRRT